MHDDHDNADPAIPALTRLADGTLPADEAAPLRAEIERSPQLAAELARQQRAVTMLRALDTPAPASLRARVDAAPTGAARTPRRRGRSSFWLRPSLPALVILAIAAVIALTNGAPSGPATIPQTARLALAASTRPAPATDPSSPGRLLIANAGISFPAWRSAAGWHASGARIDSLAGRRVVTVFYTAAGGARIGYGIVSGMPLHAVSGQTVMRYGVWFTLARLDGENLITWQRSGHTCVIAGRSVGYTMLLSLAAADERATSA